MIRNRVGSRIGIIILSFAGFVLAGSTAAVASTFAPYVYRPDLDFMLPSVASGVNGGTQMDVLPDGRLVLVTTSVTAGNPYTGTPELMVQTSASVGSTPQFTYVGDVPLPSIDNIWYNPGGFLTVSKNTSGPVRIAVGNSSYSVGVLDASQLAVSGSPTVTWYNIPSSSDANFVGTAAWLNNTQLAVGSSDGTTSQLNLLDVSSSPAKPTDPLILSGAPYGTGGVGFDHDGNLYFGVGYGPQEGDIYKFPAPGWLSSAPQDFSAGTLVASELSASPLVFDASGNLIVGGGVLSGPDYTVPDNENYIAIVNGASQVQTLDPDPTSGLGHNVLYDSATGELLVWDNNYYSESEPQQVYVYTLAESVPEPSTLALLAAGIVAAAGAMLWRQRGK